LARSRPLVSTAFSRLLRHSTTIDPYLDESGSATRRLGALTLDGVSYDALDLSAARLLSIEIRTAARARLRVPCAAIGAARTPVMFTVTVSAAGQPERQRRAEIAGPGYQQWHTVEMTVPAGTLTLAIAVTSASNPASVGAVCGVPSLTWRKSPHAISRSLGFAVRKLGFSGTLRHLRAKIDSDPSARYAQWCACHAVTGERLSEARAAAAALIPRPRFTLLLEHAEDDPALAAATRASLDAQVYPEWELVPAADAAARNAALGRSRADFVAAIVEGDRLSPLALLSMAEAGVDEDVDIVYSDEDVWPLDGERRAPRFKPDWSPELLQSGMYCGRLFAVRRRVALAAGGYRAAVAGALDYDLALRASALARRIVHVPDVLYHRRAGAAGHPDSVHPDAAVALEAACAARGLTTSVEPGALAGGWRARITVADRPRIAVVIPTAGHGPGGGAPAYVAQCVRGLRQRTRYTNYELLVCDNGNLTAETRAVLDAVPHQRVTYRWEGAFNFSNKINFAVRQTTAPYVLLLNDDVEPINADWLDAMLEYAHQPQIGAVGAKLFYPDGRLQHVGVAVGVCGVVAHLLHQFPGGSQGCGGIAVTVRNCSAVTGACMLTRREVYETFGGFDEALAIDFNDVDLCLRIRRAGYRIVFTPHARLFHYESGSIGDRTQRPEDVAEMWERWRSVLERDPYYNVNFSRDAPDCRIRTCR
jgi:glycosyltransferase involved in cell wall biosynthesis